MDALFGPDGTQAPAVEPLFPDPLFPDPLRPPAPVDPALVDPAQVDPVLVAGRSSSRAAPPAPEPSPERPVAGGGPARPPAPPTVAPVPPAPRNRGPVNRPRGTVTGGRGARPVRPGEPVPPRFPPQAGPQAVPQTRPQAGPQAGPQTRPQAGPQTRPQAGPQTSPRGPRRPEQSRQVRIAEQLAQRRRTPTRNNVGCLVVALVVFGWILVVLVRAAVHSLQP